MCKVGRLLTGEVIPCTEDAIAGYHGGGRESEDGEEDEIRLPGCSGIATLGSHNGGGGYELCYSPKLAAALLTTPSVAIYLKKSTLL